MKTFLDTLVVLALIIILLAPMFTLAKDEVRKPSKDRKAEFNGPRNKLVEKVKDKSRSKGTNTVYKTSREFPLMFSAPPRRKPSEPSKR